MVALVCAVFLFYLRSALVIILSLPVGILVAFIIMERMGINANIMSLGGIAIAIGGMVSATILTLIVIPAVFLLWKSMGLRAKKQH